MTNKKPPLLEWLFNKIDEFRIDNRLWSQEPAKTLDDILDLVEEASKMARERAFDMVIIHDMSDDEDVRAIPLREVIRE